MKFKYKKLIIMSGLLIVIAMFGIGVKLFVSKDLIKIESRVDNIINYQKEKTDYKVNAWLRVPGTNIDYPVLEGKEDIMYQDGSVQFLWQRGSLDKLNRINLIMGHNIMNLSSNPLITDSNHVRFEQLMSFTYLDFAKENQYIQLTIEDKDYLFKIFSVSYPYSGDVITNNSDKYGTEDVEKLITQSLKDSIYNYDIDVNKNDTIVSLITCTRMFGNNSREFRVDARLLRKNEKIRRYQVVKSDKYKEVETRMKGEIEENEEV